MKEFIEKLIGRLEEESNKWLDIWDKDRCDNYADGMNDAFDEAIEIVNQLAEEYNTIDINELFEEMEQNDGWIPCSERLPKINKRILVFDVISGISIEVLGEDEEFIETVIAWQPLPTPYKTME